MSAGIRNSLRNMVGENTYAILRRCNRLLRGVTNFLIGIVPRPSSRQTMLTEYDGRFYLLFKNAHDESPLIAGDAYEPTLQRLMRGLVKPGDTVIDVGANCGLHTVLLSQLCGAEGLVCAFEPVDYNIQKLMTNLSLNGCRNVALHPYALGEESGTKALRKIRDAEYFKGNSSLVDNEKLSRELAGQFVLEYIQVRTLDAVVSECDLEVDLIKIDVEGYEYQVLLGAERTITTQTPPIIMEYFSGRLRHLALSENNFRDLLDPYYNAYEICVSNRHDRYESLDPFRLIAKSPAISSYFQND